MSRANVYAPLTLCAERPPAPVTVVAKDDADARHFAPFCDQSADFARKGLASARVDARRWEKL
jgi:hypothetical protein